MHISQEDINKAASHLVEVGKLLGGAPFMHFNPENLDDLYSMLEGIYAGHEGILLVFFNKELMQKIFKASISDPEAMKNLEEQGAFGGVDTEGIDLVAKPRMEQLEWTRKMMASAIHSCKEQCHRRKPNE